MSKKGKVLVAMSGGIDSTVAALMLHKEGYEVVGITMKTWDYAASGGSKKETGCCNLDSFNDARQAAVEHGFPHFILDIREEFGDFVIENFGDSLNPIIHEVGNFLYTDSFATYQWYFNGAEIPDATNREYKAKRSGIFQVEVSFKQLLENPTIGDLSQTIVQQPTLPFPDQIPQWLEFRPKWGE